MTREEAVDNLKCLLECNYVDSFEDAENEALDMAIQALEQEPCDNAINRQAVLEIFGYVMDYWKEHAIDVEPHEIKDALIEQYEFTAKQLSELPPVNPHENAINLETVIEWLKAKDIIKLFSQEETARKELKALLPVNPQEPQKERNKE